MFLYLCPPSVQASPDQSGTSPKKITVKGTVLDDAKEPLIGVSVLVKGIDGGTMSYSARFPPVRTIPEW